MCQSWLLYRAGHSHIDFGQLRYWLLHAKGTNWPFEILILTVQFLSPDAFSDVQQLLSLMFRVGLILQFKRKGVMRSLLSDGIAGLLAPATTSNSSVSFVKRFRQRAAYVSVGEQKAIGVLYFFTAIIPDNCYI